MTITWDCIEALESEALLDEFEQLIDWRLPEDFREFVKKYNSCRPEKLTCFVPEGDEERVFGDMYDFNRSSVSSIWDFYDFPEEDCKWFKEQYGGDLHDYFAFADDPSGNSICFNKKTGEVVFYDREADKISKIAVNFTAFLDALYVSGEDVID